MNYELTDYELIVNGNSRTIRASSPEIVVRCEMCWYLVGTVFEVRQGNNVWYFKKIESDNDVAGYVDLIEI